MSLEISPSLKHYYKALDRRHQCIWFSSLHLLFCYSEEFYIRYGSNDLALTWSTVRPSGIIELGWPYDVKPSERTKPLGVKIWCLPYCLEKGSLLGDLNEVQSIQAERIVDDIEAWTVCKQITPDLKAMTQARVFLRDEICTIPRSIWKQALTT
jgi:hypothetical protein